MSYVKIGVAGPVGSGKTALIEALSRKMAKDYSIGVITNDIYTKEDAQFLAKNSVLPVERIIGVETGGCPHTAIREDASMNLEAVDEMMERFPDIEPVSYTHLTCINCNTTRTEEIPATGEHPNTEIRGAKSATCLEEGYTGDTYCKDCGIKLSSGTVIPKTCLLYTSRCV